MGETGSLDPRAQEFWPTTNPSCIFLPPAAPPPPIPLLVQTLPPPPPPPPPKPQPITTQVFFPYHPPPPLAYVTNTPPSTPLTPPPYKAPTRSILLTMVPSHASETFIRRDLEVFGEVRGVQMEKLCEGIVIVHFYDLRHSEKALKEIRARYMHHQMRLNNRIVLSALDFHCYLGCNEPPLLPPARGLVAGCSVWAQFVIPSCNSIPCGNNQGTIVLFNLDPNVSTSSLKEIFQTFGAVKELRETPLKRQQRFVEFYDVRDAAKALREMNGKEINGRQVVIEFSRPGGCGRKTFNAGVSIMLGSSDSKFSRISSPTAHLSPPPPLPPQQQLPGTRRRGLIPGSGEGNACKIADVKDSIEASLHCLSLSGKVADGNVSSKRSALKRNVKRKQNGHYLASTSMKSQAKGGSSSSSGSGNSCKTWKSRQAKKLDTRFLISEDAVIEDKCNDSRTTVMIKNIPNKYSQKLLLNMLDNHCIHYNEQIANGDDQPLSSYDFVYLPIDFNNKCNVGYGFVNMTSPQATLRLYKAFNYQHWEVFNSRKICEVTYARVQGLEALKEHFKNSKFPCEMEHYLPVVFSPSRDGRQLTDPLPIVGHKQHQQLLFPYQDENQPMIIGLLPPTVTFTTKMDEMDGVDSLKNSNDNSTDQEEEEEEEEEEEPEQTCGSLSEDCCQNGGV